MSLVHGLGNEKGNNFGLLYLITSCKFRRRNEPFMESEQIVTILSSKVKYNWSFSTLVYQIGMYRRVGLSITTTLLNFAIMYD